MKICLQLCLFIMTAVKLFAQEKTTYTTIPFTVEKNCIFIYCKVNDTDSLKFLFDTGADGSVINSSANSKLVLNINGKAINVGSNGQQEVEKSAGNTISLGNIQLKDVLFTLIAYGDAAFDGVMGTDLMQGHIIEIDYFRQQLIFYKHENNDIDWQPYTKCKIYDELYPTCMESKIIIGDKTFVGLFGLDTGADDAFTIAAPYARKNDFINQMKKIGAAHFQGSDGSKYELPIVLCPEVLFAGKHLYRIPTALSNATEGIDASDKIAGFFGNAFLKKFNTIIDYKNKFIYFKLNHHLYTDFYED